MPPPGGFAHINVERTLPKPILRQGFWFAIVACSTIFGPPYIIRSYMRRNDVLRMELGEHFIAASPFLIAEQERAFLSQLRYLREDERELMKDHPGWKLGTFYGEPVYKTLPKGAIPPLGAPEYYRTRPLNEFLDKVQNFGEQS